MNLDLNSRVLVVTFAAIALGVAYVIVIWYVLRRRRILRTFGQATSPAQLSRILPLLVAAIAAMGSLISGMIAFGPNLSVSAQDNVPATLDSLQTSVASLDSRIVSLATDPLAPGTNDSSTALTVQATLAAHSEAIAAFEGLVLSEPERLLSLPLIQRDLQSIEGEIDALDSQISTLRDLLLETSAQNRWVIGTLALGTLALIVPVARSLLPGQAKKDGAPDDGGA